MALRTKKEVAEIIGVSASAISKAVARRLLVLTGDLIDTSIPQNELYIQGHFDQRRTAQYRHHLQELRSNRSELHRIMGMKPGYDRVAALVDHYWERGSFPDGWSYLAVRDMSAEHGLPFPLVFYSPDGEEGEAGVGAIDRGFRVIEKKGNPVVARDSDGVDHPLVLHYFGAELPRWVASVVSRALDPEEKSPKMKTHKGAVGPSAVSKHEERATTSRVGVPAGKGGGRSKSYRKVGLDVSGSKTERTGRRIPPERN